MLKALSIIRHYMFNISQPITKPIMHWNLLVVIQVFILNDLHIN